VSLEFYFHPLSSFCHKALIALYENDTAFVPHIVDLSDEKSRNDFRSLWPIGKFPVLRDTKQDRIIPESSIIIEYLDQHYPGAALLIPTDPELAREVRSRDRFYDSYVHQPMQKIVGDRIRPREARDPHGVTEAKAQMLVAYGIVEKEMATRTWAMGDFFSMADCAAAPALFYGNLVMPLAPDFKNLAAYLQRLMLRPSYARVLREAQPYMAMFPKE
jgi:glutathione S-transferase